MRFSALALAALALPFTAMASLVQRDDRQLRASGMDEKKRNVRALSKHEVEHRNLQFAVDCGGAPVNLELCVSLGGSFGFNLGLCQRGVSSCYILLDGEEDGEVIGIKATTQCNGGMVGLNAALSISSGGGGLLVGASISDNDGVLDFDIEDPNLLCANLFVMVWDQDPKTFYKYQQLCQEGGNGKYKTEYTIRKFRGDGQLSTCEQSP